jgi:hypothetical protein
MRKTADVTGGKPIAALLQSISGVSAITLALLCLFNLSFCTHMGWLDEISFRDRPPLPLTDLLFMLCFISAIKSLTLKLLYSFREGPGQEYPKPLIVYEEFDDSGRSERCL